MNTFLPHRDFAQSAACLDMRRLGKQRVEVLQILRTLCGLSDGWKNHPAVKMWRGYEPALAAYGVACCDEWVSRGHRDTCRDKILSLVGSANVVIPPWLDDAFCEAHRSNLIRKMPDHYGPLWPGTIRGLPYIWHTGLETA